MKLIPRSSMEEIQTSSQKFKYDRRKSKNEALVEGRGDLGLDGAFDEGPETRNRDHEQPQRRVVARLGVPHVARRRRDVEEEQRVREEGEASHRRQGPPPPLPPRPEGSHRNSQTSTSARLGPARRGRKKRRREEWLGCGHCHRYRLCQWIEKSIAVK
ncbi:hypothetical protein BHM03_00020302 [Ensete ventricosum]|nr:hypothetical protein BHM03_00020302 [Ensete ventricosum]